MKKTFTFILAYLIFISCFCFVGCSNQDQSNNQPEISAFQSVKKLCKDNATRLNNFNEYNYYEVIVYQSADNIYSLILFESKNEREDYIMFFFYSDSPVFTQSVYFKVYENNYKCYTLIMSYTDSLNKEDFAVCEFEPGLITQQTDITDYETIRKTDTVDFVYYKYAFLAILNQIDNYLSQQNIKLSDFGFTQFN